MMEIFHDPAAIQSQALTRRKEGLIIGFAPTMGALHEGHLTLMREAREACDILAVSVFVNPKQFGPQEDLNKYPRDFEGDRRLCEKEKVDWLFYPTPETMYPQGFRTQVLVEGWGETLCGHDRPIHFQGVTLVVLKLFNILQPSKAYFGWKDAQQFLILKRMVMDLNLPIEMNGVETVRESDGLAMSSRNAYLSARERLEAPVLRRALISAREKALCHPETPGVTLKADIRAMIATESSAEVDYVELVSIDDMNPAATFHRGAMIALAARFGKTRLIDNMRLE